MGDLYVHSRLLRLWLLRVFYLYYYADGSPAYGTSVGVKTSNHVSQGNWYEQSSDEGIELWVYKNSTHHYSIWWFFSRASDFDYSTVNEDDMTGHSLYEMVSSDGSDADNMPCYHLTTLDAEEDCMEDDDDDDDDDEDSGNNGLLYAILTFTLVNFVAIVAFGVMQVKGTASKPMASSTSSNNL